MKKIIAGLVVAIVLVGIMFAAGVVAAPWVRSQFAAPVGTTTETKDTQVINAITRKEQVVLLGLGIQGITEQSKATTIFGKQIPGSGRVVFLQYNFHAKLGIEGKDVTIKKTAEGQYTISIPEFIFIGHDQATFKVATEDNGALSWVTPEVDPVRMVNEILSSEAKGRYIADNAEMLKDQARNFYSGIIHAVDPAAQLTFEFDQR
ncbi:hypothetical protein ACQB6R_00080 [Propionibacteriaceae bacterium G1746]